MGQSILNTIAQFVQFWEEIMAKAEYRSSLRSKKLISKALANLLTEKPLDQITVTDVVSRADINRGTFMPTTRIFRTL
jgi:restriction endonuclease